jgi:hypothetical protein
LLAEGALERGPAGEAAATGLRGQAARARSGTSPRLRRMFLIDDLQ